jgi:hypothetical protein
MSSSSNHLLNATCLKPTYTLRRQLVISYGLTSLCSISLVVVLAVAAAIFSEGVVSDSGIAGILSEQLNKGLRDSSVQTAELFTAKFTAIRGSAALLAEIARDRIAGYPNEGWEDDRYVPFVDMESSQRKYPLNTKLLPRDWESASNLNWNLANLAEHVQEREEVMKDFTGYYNSQSAFFAFQGNCDPSETDPKAPTFLENCTEANNEAPGVLRPTKTLAGLEQKAADIAVFQKIIYEIELMSVAVLVYFHNSGAGAFTQYPSSTLNSTRTYLSSGCDWMRTTNPYTGQPFATEEEIAQCHPAGDLVPLREYNPMNQLVVADQALHPGETRIFGPYLETAFRKSWGLCIGQAIFDRM